MKAEPLEPFAEFPYLGRTVAYNNSNWVESLEGAALVGNGGEGGDTDGFNCAGVRYSVQGSRAVGVGI